MYCFHSVPKFYTFIWHWPPPLPLRLMLHPSLFYVPPIEVTGFIRQDWGELFYIPPTLNWKRWWIDCAILFANPDWSGWKSGEERQPREIRTCVCCCWLTSTLYAFVTIWNRQMWCKYHVVQIPCGTWWFVARAQGVLCTGESIELPLIRLLS